jgi:hypothetical protein
MERKALHLTLHKKWFDLILKGIKKTEYRDIKPYWTSRLFNKNGGQKFYSEIIFKNGYNKNSPIMRTKFLGVKKKNGRYAIFIGEIIGTSNCNNCNF